MQVLDTEIQVQEAVLRAVKSLRRSQNPMVGMVAAQREIEEQRRYDELVKRREVQPELLAAAAQPA